MPISKTWICPRSVSSHKVYGTACRQADGSSRVPQQGERLMSSVSTVCFELKRGAARVIEMSLISHVCVRS